MRRVELDLRNDRVALQCRVRLVREDAACDVDLLVLDTGQGFDVLAPAGALPIPDDAAYVPVHFVGGSTVGRTYSAALEIEGIARAPRVDVVVLPKLDHWLVGMPVLRHFHLLLAPDDKGCSWLVEPTTAPG